MNRSNLRISSLVSILLLLFIILNGHAQSFDKYGGYTAINQEASGYFSIGKTECRHYLYTPEGNAFVALGINHFHTTKNTNYDEMANSIKSWGFNSGCYQGPMWMWERIPYTKGINFLEIRSYLSKEKFKFEDVFDPNYLARLEEHIKKIVIPQAENKMLVGYFLTDMPVWTKKKYGQGWIDFYRSLDENSHGGKAFQKWKNENPHNPEHEFLAAIARQLYTKGIAFIKKYDSNHLVFSDRYNEEDVSEDVIREILPFVDVIATQPSNKLHPEYFEFLYNTFQKPIYIADHVSSFATDEFPVTMGQVAGNEKDYFAFYSNYLETVFSLPYIIGFNKCQYENERRPNLLKQGLTKEDGKAYKYVKKLNKVHQKALYHAYGINK